MNDVLVGCTRLLLLKNKTNKKCSLFSLLLVLLCDVSVIIQNLSCHIVDILESIYS